MHDRARFNIRYPADPALLAQPRPQAQWRGPAAVRAATAFGAVLWMGVIAALCITLILIGSPEL